MIFSKKDSVSINKSDEELIGAYNFSGDLKVLGDLYGRYMHLVYGVCLKYLKNSEDAKDAVMLIFEKLIIEIPKHKIENFRSWLHVVTKNFCLMEIRSGKSKDEKHSAWINESMIFMENDDEMHPIDDESNIDEALNDCIERLKNEQKQCIRLFYFDNMCYNDIADILRVDENKVKSYLQNGKRNLKLCLEEKR